MGIDWDKVVLGPVMGVFGEPVLYMPASGAPFQISGVFDEQYLDVSATGGMEVQSTKPLLGVRLAEFPSLPRQKDTLTIVRTNETFIVKEVRPDGHGSAKLLLNGAD